MQKLEICKNYMKQNAQKSPKETEKKSKFLENNKDSKDISRSIQR